MTAKASDDILKLEKFNFACKKAKSSGKLNKEPFKNDLHRDGRFFIGKINIEGKGAGSNYYKK